MKTKPSEFKVGVTVILALVILIFGILWGKQVRLTTSTYSIYVRFSDIVGLEEGAYVLVNGLKRGKVKQFTLEQEGVLAELVLDSSVKLYTDARFSITSPELMGGQVVNVFPGVSAVAPAPGRVFVGDEGGGMNKLLALAQKLGEKVDSLVTAIEITVENVNKTAGDPKLREAFASSLQNLDESSEHARELIILNEGKLNLLMDNLVSATSEIRNLIETRGDDIDRGITDFIQFMTKLNELTDRLNVIAKSLQSDQGTLGLLLNDAEMARRLQKTVADLDSLIMQVRQDGIQTNVSLFGKRKKK